MFNYEMSNNYVFEMQRQEEEMRQQMIEQASKDLFDTVNEMIRERIKNEQAQSV